MIDQPYSQPQTAASGPRTFYIVEVVHGSSHELNELACSIVRLGVESAIACARVQLHNRKNAPQIFLRFEGTVQS